MSTKTSDLHVQINFYYHLDGGVGAFAKLRDVIGYLEDAGIDVSVDAVGVGDDPAPSPSPPTPATTAPGARKRTRSARDKDKAADKGNGADALDLAEPAEPEGAAAGVHPVLDEFDDPGEDETDELGLSPLTEPPSAKSGAEAWDDAMSIVRAAWAFEPKPKQFPYRGHVKALQSKFGVASFRDIPHTDGHRLYKAALEMAEEVGLRS